MNIDRQSDGTLALDLQQEEVRKLAKDIIDHAEDAHSTLLNLAYLINEAWYDARNDFRQPPHAWEPGARQP
jgi:hypothetical protein